MGYLEKSIVVDAPVGMCYNHWSNVANYPCFMKGVERVEPADDIEGEEEDLFHWTGRTPAGELTVWDMNLEEVIPSHLIAWRSAATNPVFQTEIVQFEPIGPNQCQVTLTRTFQEDVPTGGEFFNERFCQSPRVLEHDLRAFKRLVEAPPFPAIRMTPERTIDLESGQQEITAWPPIRLTNAQTFPEQSPPGDVPDIGAEYSNIGVSETTKKSDFDRF